MEVLNVILTDIRSDHCSKARKKCLYENKGDIIEGNIISRA